MLLLGKRPLHACDNRCIIPSPNGMGRLSLSNHPRQHFRTAWDFSPLSRRRRLQQPAE